jgi:hypothetical protein
MKPLSVLSVDEVTHLLKSLNLTKYCAAFKEREVDGEVLIECETVIDVIGLGIPETEVAFAKKLLKNINKFNDSGVPLELLSKVIYHCGFLKIIRLKLYFIYVCEKFLLKSLLLIDDVLIIILMLIMVIMM